MPRRRWLGATGRCRVMCNRRVVGVARGRLLKGEGIAATGDQRRAAATFRVVFQVSAWVWLTGQRRGRGVGVLREL